MYTSYTQLWFSILYSFVNVCFKLCISGYVFCMHLVYVFMFMFATATSSTSYSAYTIDLCSLDVCFALCCFFIVDRNCLVTLKISCYFPLLFISNYFVYLFSVHIVVDLVSSISRCLCVFNVYIFSLILYPLFIVCCFLLALKISLSFVYLFIWLQLSFLFYFIFFTFRLLFCCSIVNSFFLVLIDCISHHL